MCDNRTSAKRGSTVRSIAMPYGCSHATREPTRTNAQRKLQHSARCRWKTREASVQRRMHTTARGAATQRGALTRSEVKPALGASRCLTDTAARTRNARCRHAMRGVATPSEAPGARRKQPHNARGRRYTTREVAPTSSAPSPRSTAQRRLVRVSAAALGHSLSSSSQQPSRTAGRSVSVSIHVSPLER